MWSALRMWSGAAARRSASGARLVRVALAAVACLATSCAPTAAAAGRYALLIANQTYADSIGSLKNPKHDADLVAKALADVDFDVAPLVLDADAKTIRDKVYEFVETLRNAGSGSVGYLYYVGHGMASSDERTPTNYLLPVTMTRTDNRTLNSEAVPLSEVTEQLRKATREGINVFVTFDACRNLAGTRGRGRGFVPIEHVGGMLIAFSTQPNATASDGEGGSLNGPFALALATNIRRPGNYQAVYSRVKEDVLRTTNEEQHPLYIDDITTASLAFLEDKKILAAWNEVKASDDPVRLVEFARAYRGTDFAGEAEDQFNELRDKAIEKARNWLKSNGKLHDGDPEHFSASPIPYGPAPQPTGPNDVKRPQPSAWQVVYEQWILVIDPKSLEVLKSVGATSEPPPAGIAGAVFLDVYQMRPGDKDHKGGPPEIIIDERNGNYDRAISRAAENVFLYVHGFIDFMRLRLGHGDYIKSHSKTLSNLKVYVWPGLDNSYFCSEANSYCPTGNSFVVGDNMTEALDVIGHELSHQFLLRDIGLVYADESGAVLEAFADLFGELFENYYTRGGADWLMAEKVPGLSSENPMRSLKDPTMHDAAGTSHFSKSEDYSKTNNGLPDHYSLLVNKNDKLCDSVMNADNGCVHFNMGILNKAFYLISEGGLHYKVTTRGIGSRKLERIAYRAIMFMINPTDGLADAGKALLSSCRDLAEAKLFDIVDDDCQQVVNALTAVGLHRK